MDEADMSWGPCYEPSYQFFGQCMDKITKVRLPKLDILDINHFRKAYILKNLMVINNNNNILLVVINTYWTHFEAFLFQKSKDPSPLLPFWDKMRLLFRGSLHYSTKLYTLKLLSEREPSKDNEYLSLCASDFIFTWTNGM